MRMKQRAPIITAVKRKIYECDAATIAYYRRNPVIAARDLLGIYAGTKLECKSCSLGV